jgi:beta-glucosidase
VAGNAMTAFPKDFLWGAATSAYQIEGSPLADGAGPSNWHRFCHAATVGPLLAENGDLACDHYHRWRGDIELMRELGLQAYRFSLSWSRIFPAGKGRVNPAGLDFYSRLVDGLLAAGIRPMVTLYHWDLPAALDDEGGWLNPDVAKWFADYAHQACSVLSDRVGDWTTMNEPWVVADQGYLQGAHAPGHRDFREVPRVSHNLLRAHGLGVQACRAAGARQVGLVVNLEPKYPASERPEDLAATRRADAYMNRQYLDPVFLGRYPDELSEIFGAAWPDFPPEDFALIGQPLDFLGINYYSRGLTRHDPSAFGHWSTVPHATNRRTDMDWEVFPQGLRDVLLSVKQRYPPVPLYITENGAAFPDPETASGGLRDPLRVDYFRSHLLALREAMAAGVDVRGYFAWSLLDNFEWAFGYSKRFGLIHVDFRSQQRTLKNSARFYAEVIRSNGAVLA